MNILFEFIKALWILFPAYIANMSPTLLRIKKHPIDFGRSFGKHRIFGDGKSFEGFAFGVFIGTVVGIVEAYFYPMLNVYATNYGFMLPTMNLMIAFLISFGTMFGDLAGSFIKRRLGYERGANVILLDQLNFVFGMMLFAYWFTQITITMFIIMLIITPIIHRISCIIGYKLKAKREPW